MTTAKELMGVIAFSGTDRNKTLENGIELLMIEFAKLHVQAALKAAAEEAKVCKDMGELENGNVSFEITECYYDENDYPIYVEEDSILTAYPLENIK